MKHDIIVLAARAEHPSCLPCTLRGTGCLYRRLWLGRLLGGAVRACGARPCEPESEVNAHTGSYVHYTDETTVKSIQKSSSQLNSAFTSDDLGMVLST